MLIIRRNKLSDFTPALHPDVSINYSNDEPPNWAELWGEKEKNLVSAGTGPAIPRLQASGCTYFLFLVIAQLDAQILFNVFIYL